MNILLTIQKKLDSTIQ